MVMKSKIVVALLIFVQNVLNNNSCNLKYFLNNKEPCLPEGFLLWFNMSKHVLVL